MNLDRCRVVDINPGAEHTEYEKLRALMVADGVSVSDVSDFISLNVRDVEGVQVYFKIKGGSPLARLMGVYAQRQGGQFWFFYRPDEGSDAIRLTEEDTPRGVGIPDGGTIEAIQ